MTVVSSMLALVAGAIEEHGGEPLVAARAVLAVMRLPAPEVLAALAANLPSPYEQDVDDIAAFTAMWEAAIDAAAGEVIDQETMDRVRAQYRTAFKER